MDTLNLCNQINKSLNYIKPFLPLVNCHMVNYITDDLFEKLVPKEFKEEVKVMKTDHVRSLFLRCYRGENIEDKGAQEFVQYLLKSKNMYLRFNKNSIDFEMLKQIFSSRGYSSLRSLHLEQFMSFKKTHEVEIMSAVANAMATNTKCSHVVDIGGGKGYLSSMLALEHNLKVLSIDASKVNSDGAMKRTIKLKKVWNGIRKKFPQDYTAAGESRLSSESNSTKPHSTIDNTPLQGSLKQVVQFVSENTQLLQMVNEQYPDDICEKLMVVGLHTCGNLSPSSLKLFVKNSDHARGLINVGCCYHLIDEEFEPSPFWSDEEMGFNSYGFPMSSYLQKTKFALGRNARMLAVQSLDRLSNEGEINTEPLFYRALLEAFLLERLGYSDLPKFRIGRLASKCLNFAEYFHKSIKKLKIDNMQVKDAELEQFYMDHKLDQELLQKFFIIRLVLAPVIEEIILLDRLLYLHEQGIQDSFIAQLFDPVVSPRCYAIVAFNHCK